MLETYVRLIKARPKIQLILPSYAHPGDEVTAEVVLQARREVPLRKMKVRLVGEEAVVIPYGNATQRHDRVLCAFEATLLEGETVSEGRSRHRVRFVLPPDLPPSHRIRTSRWVSTGASVDYTVSVALDIPWWPDAEAEFVLHVRERPRRVRDPGSTLHATSVEGPSGKEPHVEFTLPTRHVLPGDTLRGELALGNVDFNRYKTAVLALVGFESLNRARGALARQSEALRYAIEIDVSSTSEGEAVPFVMKLPDQLPASFKSLLWELRWVFEVKVRIAWGNDLVAQVPVTVMPPGSDRVQARRRAAPRIGGERLAHVWTSVGEELGLDFDAEEAVLRGRVGRVDVRLRREHRGADGLFLVADLRYPSLGLGIDGGLAGSLRRVIGGGVSIGREDWDKRHYLTGREEAQVRTFAAALEETLLPLQIRDVEDDALVAERRDAGQNRAPLLRFGQDVLALARALPDAARAIPPPTIMAEGIEGWRLLAERLAGELRTGDMAVHGRLDGAAVAVATVWGPSGEPEHTSIEYAGEDIASEKHTFAWADGRYLDGDVSGLTEGTQKLLTDLLAEAKSLTVATNRLVLWDARAPILDSDRLLMRLEQLAALAGALRGRGGPYR